MSELSYLYVIEFENGTVKVGRSSNISTRISDHKSTGAALGVPVSRVWQSDAHEHSYDSENRLLAALPSPTSGREWFREVLFNDVVQLAEGIVELSTDPEMYFKRLHEAVKVVEAHTGTKVRLTPRDTSRFNLNVTEYFVWKEDAFVMSSVAFDHYVQRGGTLPQKSFISEMESQGARRKRVNEGTRLYGIALKP